MARQTDVFGFDELEKAFNRMQKKYENRGQAMLAAEAAQAAKRLRQITPVGPPKKISGKKKHIPLKKSVRTLKPKEFKGGEVLVSRIQNPAPHMHLVELGHNIYTSKRKLKHKVSEYNALGKKVNGIKSHGRVEGKFMIDKVLAELRGRFPKSAEKLFDEITREVQL